MKYSLIAVGLAAATVWGADSKPEFKNDQEKASYMMGVNIGKNWKRQLWDLSPEIVAKGIHDGYDDKTLFDDKETRDFMMKWQSEMRTKLEAKKKEEGVKNKADGEAFLAANAKKPGIKVTPSGLQYKVVKEGSGPIPSTNDTVMTHYRGTLINGKEFDSSYKRGTEPVQFQVNRVIRGWTEALSMMKVGSKWEVFIPSDLAYGERGGMGDIGPNAALVFDVELVGIKPPVETAPLQPAQPVTSDIIKVPSAEELKAGAKIEVIKPGTLSTNK